MLCCKFLFCFVLCLYVFQAITSETIPWSMFDDENVWTLEEQGHFSLKSSYELICNVPNQQIQWTVAIWLKGCIKKHSICAWMLLRGRLKTKDLLLHKNVACDSYCVLCDCTW
eukprot:TRINITY_DN13817_c0_g1_i10.p1 TRINITY_DN13817_c0_g1~~TRINITY_DN13817_c0_g1_i10.p1  ORF type:complete len:113 (-),score=6.98 TRINITY_DN13817_c0_g1_i10:719-1057(-)